MITQPQQPPSFDAATAVDGWLAASPPAAFTELCGRFANVPDCSRSSIRRCTSAILGLMWGSPAQHSVTSCLIASGMFFANGRLYPSATWRQLEPSQSPSAEAAAVLLSPYDGLN